MAAGVEVAPFGRLKVDPEPVKVTRPHEPVPAVYAQHGDPLCAAAYGDPESEVTRERERIEATPLTVSTRIAVTLEQLDRLKDVKGIDARFSDRHIAMSVFAFDDDMIVTPHLSNLVGHESPALHLRRCQDDGLFDRFASHVSALWDQGRDVWQTREPAAG